MNGLKSLKDILKIEPVDIEKDKKRKGDLNLTSVDAVRIAYDLVGRGILNEKHIGFIKDKISPKETVKPILHPNQYFHLLRWLKQGKQINDKELKKFNQIMQKEEYTGI